MANYYNQIRTWRRQFRERELSNRALTLTDLDKIHLSTKLKISLRETFANHFEIFGNQFAQLLYVEMVY